MKSILNLLLGGTGAMIVKEIAKAIIETRGKKDSEKVAEECKRYTDEISNKVLHRVYKDIRDITIVIRLLLIGFFITTAALIVLIILFVTKS